MFAARRNKNKDKNTKEIYKLISNNCGVAEGEHKKINDDYCRISVSRSLLAARAAISIPIPMLKPKTKIPAKCNEFLIETLKYSLGGFPRRCA